MSYTSHDPAQRGLWDHLLEAKEAPVPDPVLALSPTSPEAMAEAVRRLRLALVGMLDDPARAVLVPDRMLETIARGGFYRWRSGLVDLVQLIEPERVTKDGVFVGQVQDGLDGDALLEAILGSNV